MKLDYENLPRTVAIVGSRYWHDDKFVEDVIWQFVSFFDQQTTLVSGGATGVDGWAEDAAKFFLNIKPVSITPDKLELQLEVERLKMFGTADDVARKKAYAKVAYARNKAIVERVKKDDGIIFAFKYMESKTKGTDNTCEWCDKLLVPCIQFRLGDNEEWQQPTVNQTIVLNKRWNRLIL